MPMFLCVSCFDCKMFQAIQQKKASNKFACKICHAKQSIRKVWRLMICEVATGALAPHWRHVALKKNTALRIPV